MSISQGFGDVRSRARQGRVGALVYTSRNPLSYGAGLNKEGQAAQVGTIVVDTATNSATYTWTINGVTMTYVADSSTTKIEIAAGIVAAIDAEPLVRGQVSAESDGVDTVTLTATNVGVAFTASDSDAKLTTTEASTAAASADTIPFGRAVIDTGRNTGEGEQLLGLASTGIFAAQVITVVPTYVSGAVIEASVYEIRGAERVFIKSAIFASATDLDTTIDGLVTALNAALPANTVLVAADAATATAILFTAEIDGLQFDVEFRHNSGGASSPTFTKTYTTGPSISTSLNMAFLGVSQYSPSYEATSFASTAEAEYPANSMVTYRKAGAGDSVWVQSSESPTNADPVYVELAPGATAGRFYVASSATRVALARAAAQWERDGFVANDSLAALRLGS